jgi:RimJ/RimL family protein N-acetyltransferase
VWFLFQDRGRHVGVAYAHAVSTVRVYVNIFFVPQHVHHRDRKQAGKDLVKYLGDQGVRKLETTVPVKDTVKLRYFSQIGFKREGVARSSIIIDGELRDQNYLGYVL